jgi:beta-aspartyl-peptidase (threonine type)
MPEPVILVHGGAGWRESAARLPAAIAACEEAARAGQEVLASGGSALDAVERAVCVLEDEPLLNAGRGSYANTAGEIEMDALIMEGAALDLGAVIGITRVLHPISLARRVMSDTPHAVLAGEGASRFADAIGFPRCDPAELAAGEARPAAPGDTVGAVALDANGNLAAATSTGGIPRKLPGRVGDSPLAGCGAYADNGSAAVSATGDGEALMKIVISKLVADRVAGGAEPQRACEAALDLLRERFPEASGGLIALDAQGRLGVSFSSAAMPHAYAIGSGAIVTGS